MARVSTAAESVRSPPKSADAAQSLNVAERLSADFRSVLHDFAIGPEGEFGVFGI